MGVIDIMGRGRAMAGAYTAFVVQGVVGNAGLSLLVSLPLGFLVGGLLGLLLEATLIHRMYKRPLDTLLVTWGVALILPQVARDVFGAPNVDVRAPPVGAPSTCSACTVRRRACSSWRSPSSRSSRWPSSR